MKHFTSTGLYTAGCMDRAPFHWIHCSRFCVKGAPCLSEGRYSSLPLIPFLMSDTVFTIEAIELVWEPGKVQPASHRRRDLEWIINITKASPRCRTKEPDSSAGVTGSLSCLPSESPSRAGSGCCLSGAEQGSPRVSWGEEERRREEERRGERRGEERRGEERRGEERREVTVHTLRCSAGWRRKRRCLYWSYSRGWTVSSPMLVSRLFGDGGVLQLRLICPSCILTILEFRGNHEVRFPDGRW